MEVTRKLNPGKPGTKRLMEKYGEKLVCVRYRYDAHTNRRLTTVELIVSSKQTVPPELNRPIYPHPNELVFVEIAYHEIDIRERAKESGAYLDN